VEPFPNMNNAPVQTFPMATIGASSVFQIGAPDAAPAASRFLNVRWVRGCIFGLLSGLLVGCGGFVPNSGPSAGSMRSSNAAVQASGIQVIDLNETADSRIFERRASQTFAEGFRGRIAMANEAGSVTEADSRFRYGPKLRASAGTRADPVTRVEAGDSLALSIMEAPPASLFGAATVSGGVTTGASAPSNTNFKEQMIEGDGTIDVPFAGRVQAAGRSLHEIEDDIVQRLKNKANQPQVLVQLASNKTAYVSVFGPVSGMSRMPLTPKRERLLDALASAGMPHEEVNKLTIRVTRGAKSLTMPMDKLVKDLRQNIVLHSGDVITVQNHPYSFTSVGATGRSDEILFEGQGINLMQALARAGGLNDSRANARGVFIFRFETESALGSLRRPGVKTWEGKGVPVVYSLKFSDPASFHIAESFPIDDRDLIYVANSPGAQLQKFFAIIGTILAPAESAATTGEYSAAIH
jgi:polysaccharide export outer membrane protein